MSALDGATVADVLEPADAEAVAATLRSQGEAGGSVVPLGAGRHLALGNPPERVDAFLSTRNLAGIETFLPGEGVCRAGAGTTLGELRRAAADADMEIPLDGPDAATLGGALAAASVGPRSHVWGRARDAVLGLDVALASGELSRCGGRVVKNVTGYDLAKLYTGSHGSLGVITAAWLRLRPRPETTQVRRRAFDDAESALAAGARAARDATLRACVLVLGEDGSLAVAEWGGDGAAVAADAGSFGGEAVEGALLDELAERQWSDSCALRVRVAALATELGAVSAPLCAAGGRVLVHPGTGLVYASFDDASWQEGEQAALRAAASASGPLRFEVAPLELKRRRCVFGAPDAEVALFRSLKQRFDPDGALSRGRFAGRL